MDFGLKRFDVSATDTKEFKVSLLDAILIVRPATEANKDYFNKVLKKSRKRLNAAKRGNVDAAVLAESRDEDRELYPKYVVVDWRDVYDKDGEPVEFSVDNCRDLLKQMPPWMFDELREFASEISNFIDVMDVDEKVKN